MNHPAPHELSDLAWRKSSRSGGGSGHNCVEAAAWRKGSKSAGNGNCVEAGTCACHGVAVRDSKHLAGTPLMMSRADWNGILRTIKR